MSSFLAENDRQRLVIFGILRHYWRLKIPLAEAINKIRQTEGAGALLAEEAQKWFGLFELGQFGWEEANGGEIGGSQIEEHISRMEQSRQIPIGAMLPNELWVEVFSFLQMPQFMCLEWVCANLRSIVNTFFWPKVHRLNAHILKERQFCALSNRFGPQIRLLLFGPTLDRMHLPIREIVRHMPQLERIRIGIGTKAKDFDAIPELVPNLRHANLDLSNDNYEGLPAILHGCQRLNALELSFAFAAKKERIEVAPRREFDLRLIVNRLPSRLKLLRTFECGLFLPHLLELAIRDCGPQLQVLIMGPYLRTEFETAEVAESLVLFRNLRFLNVDIDLAMLKMCITHHPDAFRSLHGLSCGFFDNELLSLIRRNCPDLEHLSLGQLPRGVGRSTYRALGHFVKKLSKLRALDVREVAEFSHIWRLKCGWQMARNGHESLEFLNLMIDVPFEMFLLIVKNFKCLKCLNCFTILDFSLGPMLEEAFENRPIQIDQAGRQIPLLQIGIVNKVEFEKKFEQLEQKALPAIRFQKYSVENPVEVELKKIDYDEN